MAKARRIRLEELDKHFSPAPVKSQGTIEKKHMERVIAHKGRGLYRVDRPVPRPEDLSPVGRRRVDTAPTVVRLVPDKMGRLIKLDLDEEGRRLRARQKEREYRARKTAAETPEEREARRQKQRLANAKFRQKQLLQILQDQSDKPLDRIVAKMRRNYEEAYAWAKANPDLAFAHQLGFWKPYTPNQYEERLRAGEEFWRLDVRIRHGWAPLRLPSLIAGYAVSATSKPQIVPPGTNPPFFNFTGDIRLDYRQFRR